VTPFAHLLPLTAAIARAFPLYNRKTKDPHAIHVVNIEYIVIDGEINDEDVTTLETVAHSVRNAAKIVDTPCNELGVSEFVEVIGRFFG
jgi:probable aminopeptidase NPEPL1